jgi:hypothetical protein
MSWAWRVIELQACYYALYHALGICLEDPSAHSWPFLEDHNPLSSLSTPLCSCCFAGDKLVELQPIVTRVSRGRSLDVWRCGLMQGPSNFLFLCTPPVRLTPMHDANHLRTAPKAETSRSDWTGGLADFSIGLLWTPC